MFCLDSDPSPPDRKDEAVALTPEQREILKLRREQVARELDELSTGRTAGDKFDKTERRQELLDELDEISRDLGEIRRSSMDGWLAGIAQVDIRRPWACPSWAISEMITRPAVDTIRSAAGRWFRTPTGTGWPCFLLIFVLVAATWP